VVRPDRRAQLRDAGGVPRSTDDEASESSWEHLLRSHYSSIEKARTLLHYAARCEPEDAVPESVRWLIGHGQLAVATR
jgi:hypothetical protein